MKGMEESASKIYEIQYDLIARVVPGVVALAAYIGHQPETFSAWGSIVVGVVAAYVIGFTIELLAHLVFGPFTLDPLFRRLKPRKWRYLPYDGGTLWEHRSSPDCKKPDWVFKMLGETGMFRSLLLLAIITAIFPPELLREHAWVSWVAIAAFANGYYWVWTILSWAIEPEVELASTENGAEPQR